MYGHINSGASPLEISRMDTEPTMGYDIHSRLNIRYSMADGS